MVVSNPAASSSAAVVASSSSLSRSPSSAPPTRAEIRSSLVAGAALRGEGVEIVAYLDRSRVRLVHRERAEHLQHHRPVAHQGLEHRPVGGRDAEHLTDHGDRKGKGERRDEVGLAGYLLLR